MATAAFDINELKRRIHGAMQVFKRDLVGLRTGRAHSGCRLARMPGRDARGSRGRSM